MKKRTINNIILLSVLAIFTLVYRLFFLKYYLKYAEFISAAFIIVLVFTGILLLGFQKDKKTRLEQNVFILFLTTLIAFFVLYYSFGFINGFLKNSYSLTPTSILENTFSPIIMLIGIELFRYLILSANKDKNIVIVISIILVTLFDLSVNTRIINFNSFPDTFRIITMMVLPIIMKNLILSYFSYHFGYKIPILYRLIMDMYIFILPIVPDVSEFMQTVINLCLPFFMYLFCSNYVSVFNNEVEHDFYKNRFGVTDIFMIGLIIILVCLLSGSFPYYMIGIGSESMTGTINKGDAVVIKKIGNLKKLEQGDVVAYDNNGKTIVHRIVRIEIEDGTYYYFLKGDINKSEDNVRLKIDEIDGVVKFRIPLIAYPHIYLSEKLKVR